MRMVGQSTYRESLSLEIAASGGAVKSPLLQTHPAKVKLALSTNHVITALRSLNGYPIDRDRGREGVRTGLGVRWCRE